MINNFKLWLSKRLLVLSSQLYDQATRDPVEQRTLTDWTDSPTTDKVCLECKKPMWLEGRIEDDIQLCHACYSIDTLLQYGYVSADDLYEFYSDK